MGEPLAGRLSPPDGTDFVGVIAGAPETNVLLASDAGYGFIGPIGELYSKNKAGKAVLSVRGVARATVPDVVGERDTDEIACVTNEDYLLVFPARQLPELARGKGLKMMQIPAAKLENREEFMSRPRGRTASPVLSVPRA
jgi:topoisomerase-4 subunit A